MDERRRGPDGNRDQILRRRRLQAVDGGIEDRNALDDSLRLSQPELMSTPSGFSRVYVDPADPSRYVRGNGALFVVFPFSEYRYVKKKGTFAFVPAGTSFRIGMPAHLDMPPQPSPFADAAPERADRLKTEHRQDALRVDRRVDLLRDDGTSEPAHAQSAIARNETRSEPGATSATVPPILGDERYRRAFFETLRQRKKSVPTPLPS